MKLADHFEIPIFTLVDTVGAYPSFESEKNWTIRKKEKIVGHRSTTKI